MRFLAALFLLPFAAAAAFAQPPAPLAYPGNGARRRRRGAVRRAHRRSLSLARERRPAGPAGPRLGDRAERAQQPLPRRAPRPRRDPRADDRALQLRAVRHCPSAPAAAISTPAMTGSRTSPSSTSARAWTGAPRILIDPNTWAQDGATALAEWHPSRGRPPSALFGPGRRHRLAHRARARRRHRPADERRGPLGQILQPRLGQGRIGLLLFALPRARRRRPIPVDQRESRRSISTASARRRARTGSSSRRPTGRGSATRPRSRRTATG